MLDITPEQLIQIQSLGIKPNQKKSSSLVPLLSISGLTLISFGSLVLLKSKTDTAIITPASPVRNPESIEGPTQVPKSIQHYLLTSQQQFTQALQTQTTDSSKTVELINQSILTASEAIKIFPNDYRGYEQRGRIYQSLIDSQPQFLTTAIADFSFAAKLNPNSPDITRSLAGLFARQGDAQNTLLLLAQTITLEPTKAQNFYDLARLQQQVGLLPQALETYNRLLTIVSDPTQKQQVYSEKIALEKLISQSPAVRVNPRIDPSPKISPPPTIILPDSPALIQADSGTGLIIAAPETAKDLTVSNLTDSNALSGTAVLPADTLKINLTNDNLTSSSQVYLTVIKGGKNQTLRVLSRSAKSFIVGLDSPISEPIEFKWWIVN